MRFRMLPKINPEPKTYRKYVRGERNSLYLNAEDFAGMFFTIEIAQQVLSMVDFK